MIYSFGSTGPVVSQIQKALYGAGYPCGMIDGRYGAETKKAVVAFQQAKGLKADGIVGPATMLLLIPARFKKSKRRIDKIIIHCSATPELEDATVEQIRAEHKRLGWSDIGYHYVIYRDGSIHEGRDVDIQGAHCADSNGNVGSIGICYVGGVEMRRPELTYAQLKAKDTRTPQQKVALLNLLCELRVLYPNAKILGHRDLDKHGKQCPSFDAKTEYARI